jgi:ornithine carbamoyltransferase
MNHFLDIHTTDATQLRSMMNSAHAMKSARNGRPKGAFDDEQPLAGRMVALIFEKPSTRTRVSFDVGVRQMGGQTMVLSGKEMQLGHGESIADTARVLSRYVDLIMLRTFEEATLHEMAEHATVPVINGLTDNSHPCQIMADILTYEQHRGAVGGRKFVWSGDGNNVCTSWLHAAGQFGFDLTFTGPETLDPNPKAVEFARSKGSNVVIARDPLVAAMGADAIVTDTWVSMHDPESARERRHNQLRGYQVNAAMMAQGKPDALFMHCLPAHRNEEATSEVMDGPQSVIFDESENRLHAQKAILRWCLGV